MSASTRVAATETWALFVDVDAWMLDRPHSQFGSVSIRSLALLGALHDCLRGAVALISSRPIAEVDELVYPLRAACAGLQGLERRDALGGEHRLRTDLRPAHARSTAGARKLLHEMVLLAFMAEEPFVGRRPLWLAPDGGQHGLEAALARVRGFGVRPRRVRRREDDDAALAPIARVLLARASEPSGYGPPTARTAIGRDSPRIVQ